MTRCRLAATAVRDLPTIQLNAELAETVVGKDVLELVLHHLGLFRDVEAIDEECRLCLVSSFGNDHGLGRGRGRQASDTGHPHPIKVHLLDGHPGQVCNDVWVQVQMALQLVQQLCRHRLASHPATSLLRLCYHAATASIDLGNRKGKVHQLWEELLEPRKVGADDVRSAFDQVCREQGAGEFIVLILVPAMVPRRAPMTGEASVQRPQMTMLAPARSALVMPPQPMYAFPAHGTKSQSSSFHSGWSR